MERRNVTQRKWWLLSVLTVALVGLGMWGLSPQDQAPGAPTRLDGMRTWFKPGGPAPETAEQRASAADTLARPSAQPATNPLDTMRLPTFRANDKGHLAMDQQTRTDVERIHALFPRDEALSKLESQSSGLPAAAQRDLKDLYQKYSQYSQAVTQAFPPGQDNGTLDDATRQLNGLHDLRVQYFGADDAQALFGDEEKTAKELLELMRKQTDPKQSLQDKADQAQAEWKQRQQPAQP